MQQWKCFILLLVVGVNSRFYEEQKLIARGYICPSKIYIYKRRKTLKGKNTLFVHTFIYSIDGLGHGIMGVEDNMWICEEIVAN